MNPDKTGRVNGNGFLKSGKRQICAHQRLVDDHVNECGTKTGRPVCRECGEVIHDSVET